VNGRFGDPAVYVGALHRAQALLFDLGELLPLSARDLLRIDHVFVSHMHMDHFIGFDRLLRVNVGRDKQVTLIGPSGLAKAVEHKLQAYTWDLVERYKTDLVFDVIDVEAPERLAGTRFRLKNGFAAEPGEIPAHSPGPVLHWTDFQLRIAVLEHHGPSLGFAIQERLHVNVWRNRLEERGLAPGPWLQSFKRAVAAEAGDDAEIALPCGKSAPLGALRELVSVECGQKIAYVTDVADTAGNRSGIVELARDADTLFIEASFSAADADQASARAHLTTQAAGEIARAANVRRVEPFHFSPRYEGDEHRMLGEVRAAFAGESAQVRAPAATSRSR
jgi:ribonuclease Z